MYNDIKNYSYLEYLEPAEVMGYILFAIIVLVFAYRVKVKNQDLYSEYKYFTWGIFVKLFGAGAFCYIFTYYYKGGDTIAYWECARAYSNLLWQSPSDFFHVYFGDNSIENYYYFNGKTGYPWYYMYVESRTLMVVKIITPIVFIASNSYLLSSLMLAVISFSGIWKLYRLFCNYYPGLKFELALSTLFVPSAVFWGSGILKDTITLSATCWFIFAFYKVFIAKEKRLKHLLILLVAFYFVYGIKPYILFPLIPGSIIWYFYDRISSISVSLIRYAMVPLIMAGSTVLGYLALTVLTDFKIDQLLEDAVVKQTDLKREEYHGNSFDIGTYEPTVQGALSVAPAAIIAGLFRPGVWESRSVVTLLSGLENLLVLLLAFGVLWRTKVIGIIKLIFDHPLAMFCLIYSFLFSLVVGLSTSNFGALVRFKIAYFPMLISGLFILYVFAGNDKKKKIQNIRGITPEGNK